MKSQRNKIATALTVVASMAGSAQAWSGYGHMIAAAVAEDILKADSPQVWAKIEEVLKPLKDKSLADCQANPSCTDYTFNNNLDNRELLYVEDQHPFVEGVTAVDDIKQVRLGRWQSDMHFNQGFWKADSVAWSEVTAEYKTTNLNQGVTECMMVLSKTGPFKDTTVWKSLDLLYEGNADLISSFTLRLLVHLVTDGSQPLHNLNRIDTNFKNSDIGGNAIDIKTKDGADNLHAVWDKGVYKYANNPSRPFDRTANRAKWAEFRVVVDAAKAAHTIEKKEYWPYNIRKWTRSANKIAMTVYDNVIIDPNASGYGSTDLDQTLYVDPMQKVAERQMVLGGYQLATTLKKVYQMGKISKKRALTKPNKTQILKSKRLPGNLKWNSNIEGEQLLFWNDNFVENDLEVLTTDYGFDKSYFNEDNLDVLTFVQKIGWKRPETGTIQGVLTQVPGNTSKYVGWVVEADGPSSYDVKTYTVEVDNLDASKAAPDFRDIAKRGNAKDIWQCNLDSVEQDVDTLYCQAQMPKQADTAQTSAGLYRWDAQTTVAQYSYYSDGEAHSFFSLGSNELDGAMSLAAHSSLALLFATCTSYLLL